MFFFFKQKTAYEMRISDWSSDVALPIFQLAVQRTELVRASASDDPLRYDDALADQAMVLSQAGRYAQAEPIERAALAGYRTLYAADSQKEIGRESCRERVCQYVSISVVAVSLKKKEKKPYSKRNS